jgi:SAM-dependent methyltransferase
VVAIEALAMASDRGAALAEIRRVLRPGGRAMFTGGERHGGEDGDGGPAFRWAPLIEAAGLDLVSSYVDTTRSERWLAVCALWLEREADLRAALGDVAEEFIREARSAPSAWGNPGLAGMQFVVERPAGG